ncbi:hypothetical protein KR038_004499 [Drosophila bunnanda]|nr:hypothetical protein KR038_004499 [Drosophila bunnanda]
MQDRILHLDQYEDNLLHSCWKVGGSHSKTAVFSSLNRNEIAAVDVVACCKQITSLVEKNASQLQHSHSVPPIHKLHNHFKDFAQLTCGVTNIYYRQVNMLLEDTKHLLDQINGNTFNLVLTTKKSVLRTNRKRKHVITKERKLTISKRLRLDESDILNKSVQQYYADMLTESQVWQSETTQQVGLQESIELPRNYNQSSSYHALTITEQFAIHEDPSDIYATDGFGDCGHPDLTFIQSFCRRDSAKRRLTRCASTDILPAKMPRLDVDIFQLNTFQADSAISTTNYLRADSIDIDIESITYIVCEPSLPLDLSSPPSRRMSNADNDIMTTDSVETAQPTIVKNTSKCSRRKKLMIDKSIECSREKLKKNQYRYLNNLRETVVIPPPSVRRKTPEDLLFKLNKTISVFPDIIEKYSVTLTNEETDVQSEVTLRSIFGDEFTEDLVKEIFVPIKSRKMKNKNVVYQPVVPEEQDDLIVTPPLLPIVESYNINNNNILKHTISYKDNHFDAYSLMMDLLMIWRNNPEIQGIDANNYIQMFPDRIRASLAFNLLLYLVRDSFIKISKKPNSIEMDKIELGPASNKLIESLSQEIS